MNETRVPDIFPVPQAAVVILTLLGLALGSAWLTAWFFTQAMTMAAAVMLVIMGPMLFLLWNILYMKPSDTRVMVGDGAVVVEAPPYFTVTIARDALRKAYRCDIATDPHMQGLTRDAGTQIGPYRAGIFRGQGRDVVMVSRRRDAICLVTDDQRVVLGPRNLAGLAAAIESRLGVPVS